MQDGDRHKPSPRRGLGARVANRCSKSRGALRHVRAWHRILTCFENPTPHSRLPPRARIRKSCPSVFSPPRRGTVRDQPERGPPPVLRNPHSAIRIPHSAIPNPQITHLGEDNSPTPRLYYAHHTRNTQHISRFTFHVSRTTPISIRGGILHDRWTRV